MKRRKPSAPRSLTSTETPSTHKPEISTVNAAIAPDHIRPEIDDRLAQARVQRLKSERERREFALRTGRPGGRDGQKRDLTHFVPTPADPARPSGPRSWAQLDTAHPVDKMFRRGSLGRDQVTSLVRYRAACVWWRFYMRAAGIQGYQAFLSESVDGSRDPQASMEGRMQAVHERVNIQDAKGMTLRRYDDLDSIIAIGKRISEVAQETGRDQKTVRESFLAGLDAVCGYSRWDGYLQAVQVVVALPDKGERRQAG